MTVDTENRILPQVALRRAIRPDDDHFLRELYISTRDDIAELFTDDAQKAALLTMQYAAQDASYARQFPDATHDIILLDGSAVGRLIVERQSNAVRLVDIALLPDARNQGIGTGLLKLLLEECLQRAVPIELSVLKTSIARDLYERLGFRIVGDSGTHYRMRAGNEKDLPEIL